LSSAVSSAAAASSSSMSTYTRRGLDHRPSSSASSAAGLGSMRGLDLAAARSRSKAGSPAPDVAIIGTASQGKPAAEEASAENQGSSPDRKRPRPPPPGLRQTFAPCRWLNDDSISFAYTRLEQNADNCLSEGSKLSEAVLLIDPPTAFWLAMQTEVKHREEAQKALKVLNRDLVLCPINDNRDGGLADGGSHWGLLVWDRVGGQFIYYDSGFVHVQSSHQQAQTLANHLAGRPVQMQLGSCPKQTNSFDCGMYVIVFSELIVKTFVETVRAAGGGSKGAFSQDVGVGLSRLWESHMAAITPKEVADRRAFFYRTLGTMTAAAAAAGA